MGNECLLCLIMSHFKLCMVALVWGGNGQGLYKFGFVFFELVRNLGVQLT